MAEANDGLYKIDHRLKRTLRVAYPAGRGRITLRTEADWERTIEPVEVGENGTVSTFAIEANTPFLYFKPCLERDGQSLWAVGSNHLLLMSEKDSRIVYPFFTSPERGRFTPLIEIDSKILKRQLKLRVFVPPGYDENTLARYPVAYMQDGQNLFFPDEAFMGRDWNVDETGGTLRAMGAAEDFIIVGLYSGDRMLDYTKPGYEAYARAVVEEVVPREVELIRGANQRRTRTVWGSSLGGVVSFYMAWQHPETFAAAVCMSSTFSHKDNLMERVLTETPRDVAFYLDSGWPEDNFETTLAMAAALVSRGWRYGHNLLHFSYPHARHSETDWGFRLHLPMQFLNGAVARASRAIAPELGTAPYRTGGPS